MEVLGFFKAIWLREFFRNLLTNDLVGYFNAFCLANICITCMMWGFAKTWLIIKTKYKYPIKYGSINLIEYYYNGVRYLMPCVLKTKRFSNFVKAFVLKKSDSKDNEWDKSTEITHDIKPMLGSGENFGGMKITPKMLGYIGICLVYIDDELEHAEKNFFNDDTLQM